MNIGINRHVRFVCSLAVLEPLLDSYRIVVSLRAQQEDMQLELKKGKRTKFSFHFGGSASDQNLAERQGQNWFDKLGYLAVSHGKTCENCDSVLTFYSKKNILTYFDRLRHGGFGV